MKTLFTSAAVCLFTLTTMAADHYPALTIKSKRHFEFVIDGQRYFHDNFIHFDRIQRGMHTIQVYEHSRGFFGNRHRLISSRTFMVRNNDIIINVDYSGFAYVKEAGNGWGRDRKWKNRDWDRDKGDGEYDYRDRNYNDKGYDRNQDYYGRDKGRSRGF